MLPNLEMKDCISFQLLMLAILEITMLRQVALQDQLSNKVFSQISVTIIRHLQDHLRLLLERSLRMLIQSTVITLLNWIGI